MVEEIRVYFEGDDRLRLSFKVFFSELRKHAEERKCKFLPIAAGSGDTACRDFHDAYTRHPNAWNILLRDGEGPVTANSSRELCRKYGWAELRAESIFWMVEMMEAWLHADKEKLEQFYGNGFRRGALKANPNVEEILKKDLEDGLHNATKNTQKGSYYKNKVPHAAALLKLINPHFVRKAAPNCKKFFEAVLAKLE